MRPRLVRDAVRGARRAGLGWGLIAAVLSLPPLFLLVEIADRTTTTTVNLVLAATLAQLPLVIAATALYGYRRSRQLITFGAAVELGSRAEVAEAALNRERDRLHELRATVVGITLSHRLLHDRRAELNGSTRSRLERMHENELGRLERLLADRPFEATREVDLADVVEPLVESLRLRGHRVHWEGTTCRAWGRQDEVSEIVHVLLENAARHATGHDIEVGVERHGGAVEVRVRDLGPGVSPQVLPTLFERGARDPGSPGQGIGLNIAHRLSREMGGELRLEPPEPGVTGAVFVLTLPVTDGAVSCLGLSG